MNDKTKLAEVVTLYNSNSRDIPATMRRIADQIESGEYGEAEAVTIVVQAKELDVCHLGAGDSDRAYAMLSLGRRKLEDMMLERTGKE